MGGRREECEGVAVGETDNFLFLGVCSHALPCVAFQTHLGIELKRPTASSSGINGEVGRFVDNATKGF